MICDFVDADGVGCEKPFGHGGGHAFEADGHFVLMGEPNPRTTLGLPQDPRAGLLEDAAERLGLPRPADAQVVTAVVALIERVAALDGGIRTHRHTMTAGTTDFWRDCANCEERDGELWSLLDVAPELPDHVPVLAAEVSQLREIVDAVEGLSLKCANGREIGGCISCRPCLVWSLLDAFHDEPVVPAGVDGFAQREGDGMKVEQLRQLEQAANREVSCDHRLDEHDLCGECHPVIDAQLRLWSVAPRALPALLDIAEAAKAYAVHIGPEWDRLQAEAADRDRWDSWEARRKQLRVSLDVALSRLDTEDRHG